MSLMQVDREPISSSEAGGSTNSGQDCRLRCSARRLRWLPAV